MLTLLMLLFHVSSRSSLFQAGAVHAQVPAFQMDFASSRVSAEADVAVIALSAQGPLCFRRVSYLERGANFDSMLC
jgi:hypothetical protein